MYPVVVFLRHRISCEFVGTCLLNQMVRSAICQEQSCLFHITNSDRDILTYSPKGNTLPHTDLKVGLSIEAGCGDVTGAICTIWGQQHQVNWERFIFSHTNNVPHLDRQA